LCLALCSWLKSELVTQLISPSKIIWKILLNFQWQKYLKLPYLSHLRSKNYKITSIKSYLTKPKLWPNFSKRFLILFYYIFNDKIV
jgi:hypothetical protein